jgi:hypothetical protein
MAGVRRLKYRLFTLGLAQQRPDPYTRLSRTSCTMTSGECGRAAAEMNTKCSHERQNRIHNWCIKSVVVACRRRILMWGVESSALHIEIQIGTTPQPLGQPFFKDRL